MVNCDWGLNNFSNMGFLIPNNNTILVSTRIPPSLGRPLIFLNLVPVKLYNQVMCRKNSFLVSNYTWGNHLHGHIHNYWHKISALANQAKGGSLTTAVIYVLSETAPRNFGQCLSKLYLKCPYEMLICVFEVCLWQSCAILLFIFFSINIFWTLLIALELFRYMSICL